MKKILLFNFDAMTVGNLQAEYARRSDFFSTNDVEIAFHLINRVTIDVIFINVPDYYGIGFNKNITKLLKKLRKKEYNRVRKILVAKKGGEVNIDDFMKYGISAVVLDVGELGRWVEH